MTLRGPLPRALRGNYERHLVDQAKLIRDWPEGPERTAAAESHVRLALYESGVRIDESTRHRIYSLLSFVMPDGACWADEPTTDALLSEQAVWELEHQRQIEQRTCSECGDGRCDLRQ